MTNDNKSCGKRIRSLYRIVAALMVIVLAFCLVSCGRAAADGDAISTAEPTEEVTNAPTDGPTPTQAPPTEEPTPQITQLPHDIRIIKGESGALQADASYFTQPELGISISYSFLNYLNDPEYADALFETALFFNLHKDDVSSIEKLIEDMEKEAEWLIENGYNVKWEVSDCGAKYDLYLGYFYGYFTPEQLLNFPETDKYGGYSIDFLVWFAEGYGIPLEEFDLWEEEPTPERTQIPTDVRIMREVPELLVDALTETQEGIYIQYDLFETLNDPQYADALFEVALGYGMVSIEERSVEELERELQERENWLNQHGYNAKLYLRYEDEPGFPGYRRSFFYGYFTPEQLLNFPDSIECGFWIELLRYHANAYDIPLDELDIWE